MRIISRYIFRETLQTWAGVTGVLLVVIVSNQLAKVLGDAASSQLPRDEVFHILALSSLQYFPMLIPVGLFLGVLLTLGRLYRDSEMHALMACGYGPGRLFRPLSVLGIALALLVAWLAISVGPSSQLEVQRITREVRQRGDLRSIEPGRFVSLGLAGAVIYAESLTPERQLQHVFVQRRTLTGLEVIVADKAWQQDGAEPNTWTLVFENGRRYEGRPGDAAFRVIEFEQHGVPFNAADTGPPPRKPQRRLMTSPNCNGGFRPR
jgi:lipopolysaccharide export system permease protein